MQDWTQRFRVPSFSFPQQARDLPHRAVYTSTVTGAIQVYAWDRLSGTHRQVTRHDQGTVLCAVSPDGAYVWWFSDPDGDERGVWLREPFGGGAQERMSEPAWPAGLAIGRTLAVAGCSTGEGVTIHAGQSIVYSAKTDASVAALSDDESLIAIEHSEYSDARRRAVRVLRPDGSVAGELWDGPGLGLRVSGTGFEPGGHRLLLSHDRDGRPEPLIWDPLTGAETPVTLGLAGEVTAKWYPDASALLVLHAYHARHELYRYDLGTSTLTRLDSPPGYVLGAAAQRDGGVELKWTSAEHAPTIRRLDGTVLLGVEAPPSVPLEDAWVGDVHALIARPAGEGPHPAVFYLHGGPDAQDVDMYSPMRAAFVDAGYCVIHVNYRGSHGYGLAWRDALVGNPGHPELEDTAAVYDWAVAQGIADPARCVIGGASWGGYLTLLGLGTQPERWAAGLALVPIGDTVALYEDEMEPVREYDRALFGGSPDEIPEVYARSSPMTYVDNVAAPVLITAGLNDPRCPIRNVENYVNRLAALGKPHEVYRFDAGHSSFVVAERIAQARLQLDFLARHVPA
ncbi:S9 family peptidase [Longispora albida]|uniref:S9 family peptidase n=1 Tax=Longispora albida TaxID=203523 RepID=UPI00036671DC|nr:prolyl oligopeptidase family serine peptidase [Longispora albida]